MDVQRYRTRIETTVLDEDYEQITDESTGSFETVWHKQTEDPTIGVTHVFVTVVDAEAFGSDDLKETAEEFRSLLTDISPVDPRSVENLFGYMIFAASEPSEELIEFATEEYTVADRRSSVFPLIYDLETETLHLHPVPRLKGRGFYEKQRDDAEALFSL